MFCLLLKNNILKNIKHRKKVKAYVFQHVKNQDQCWFIN